MNTLSRIVAFLALPSAILTSGTALAHHSFAMFDFGNRVTIEGTVKEFDWNNPHVILWVIANPQSGKPEETWSLELTSPGNLTRAGWTKRLFKPGDRVRVTLSPLRNGETGGAFASAVFLDTGVKSPPLGAQAIGAKPGN